MERGKSGEEKRQEKEKSRAEKGEDDEEKGKLNRKRMLFFFKACTQLVRLRVSVIVCVL